MKKDSLLRIYGFASIFSLAIIITIGFKLGLSDLTTVLILAALEITFSFDNAVVNAKILSRMSKAWQKAFMTIGIAVAVFGVRLLLPMLIVSLTSSKSLKIVYDLVINHPAEYSLQLKNAHPLIASFGGLFLLMLFLDFMLTHRSVHWFVSLESALAKLAWLKDLGVIISLLILTSVVFGFVPINDRFSVLIAGVVGIMCYQLIDMLDSIFGYKEKKLTVATAKMTFKAGLISFLYLELIDASFSLDGVIGAFAITNRLILIAAGLGIGALFVRSLTVHMLRRGTLVKYRYLEHGAHYAIGVLAIMMLLGIRYQIPALVTGLSGIIFIAAAIAQSHFEKV